MTREEEKKKIFFFFFFSLCFGWWMELWSQGKKSKV